jgi:hypothetical protein
MLHEIVVRLLLKKAADVDSEDSKGRVPLSNACGERTRGSGAAA